MKKNTFRKIIALLAIFFITGQIFAENARVTYIKGKVEVSKDNRDSWIPLKVGDQLSESDVISTGFQSEVKIEFSGSIMTLGAVTRITLEKLAESTSKDDVSLYLKTGAVRSKVTHPAEKRVSYTIKTPIAVASVRGTDFMVTADGHVTCNEGAVAVYANTDNLKRSKNVEKSDEEEASEEMEEGTESSVSEEFDNGPANSTTPAEEIYAEAPAGAVVVAKNQTVSIKSNGNPETPMVNILKKNEKVRNTVTTAAAQEAVSVGGTAIVTAPSGGTFVTAHKDPVVDEQVPENTPSLAGLSVNIVLED